MRSERLIEFFTGDVISYDESGCAWKLTKEDKEKLIDLLKKDIEKENAVNQAAKLVMGEKK